MIPKISFSKDLEQYNAVRFSNIAMRKSKNVENEELPRIEFEDINSGKGTLNKNIYQKDNKHKKGIYFEQQDVLFGKLRPYLKNWYFASFNGVAIGDFWVFKAKKNIDSLYLYTLIQSEEYQYVSNISIGTKMPRSDWDLVRNYKFSIPNFKTQQKIGYLFKKLDQAVSLQQQVLEATKEYKQSMQQKMFPKKDKKVPEIRFKEFRRKWEPISLKDSIDIQGGFAFKSSQFGSGKMPIIRISNIMNNGKIVGPFKYYKEKDNFEKYKVSGGEYLIAMSGATTGKVGINKDIAYVNQRVGIIKTKLNVDNFFIGIILNMAKFQYYLTTQWGAGAQPNVSNKQIMNYNTLIPSFEEQQKIGSFFKTLDKKIEQEEKKLETYQSMKKALMQRMFV